MSLEEELEDFRMFLRHHNQLVEMSDFGRLDNPVVLSNSVLALGRRLSELPSEPELRDRFAKVIEEENRLSNAREELAERLGGYDNLPKTKIDWIKLAAAFSLPESLAKAVDINDVLRLRDQLACPPKKGEVPLSRMTREKANEAIKKLFKSDDKDWVATATLTALAERVGCSRDTILETPAYKALAERRGSSRKGKATVVTSQGIVERAAQYDDQLQRLKEDESRDDRAQEWRSRQRK